MRNTPLFLLQQQVAFDRDQSSYREIFLHFYKPLLQFAKTFVGTHEAAEEIVSDVLMKIWEMKEDLAGVANLKLYLYTAVRNRAINHLTRNKTYISWDGWTSDVSFPPVAASESPAKDLETKELRTEILSAVKSLPPKCRMVYKLVREDGLSYKEVGTLMNISVNTVDRHLNTALHKIVQAVRVRYPN